LRSSAKKKISSNPEVRDHSSTSLVLSGGLLQIFGLGVIITGHSGIGKSESALELISRGHRFISDDVVEVSRKKGGSLIGRSPSLSRYFMEIRGLGIINIKAIFGKRAICRQSKVDLVIWLKKWQKGDEYDRLGLEFPSDFEILGVKIPQLIVPVAPGRTIALLIEVACKVHLLRKRGYHASLEIVKKLDRALS
jgi:HPr kinase/phosphorylase